jgi:hypothetical protein
VQSGIERHDDTSRSDGAKISRDPAGMVIGHDGEAGSAGELVLGDPAADRFGHAAQLSVGTTLQVIMTLQLERDVAWPALGTSEETIVESGHGWWGEYTKKLVAAENADIA